MMLIEEPKFVTSANGDLCFATYTNTGYRAQNDRLLVARGTPNYLINWAKVFEQAQKIIKAKAVIPSNPAIDALIEATQAEWGNSGKTPERVITTTATLAHIRGTSITTANAGDSRASILIIDPEDGKTREFFLTKDRPQEDIDTGKNSFRKPVIEHYDLRESRFLKFSREKIFLIVETDGTHMHHEAHTRASGLSTYISKNTNITLNAETLTGYFINRARHQGCTDNMTIAVTELNKRNRGRSDLIGVFDGAADEGHIASDLALKAFEELTKTPPRDWLRSMPSPYKAHLAVGDLITRRVADCLFGTDLS